MRNSRLAPIVIALAAVAGALAAAVAWMRRRGPIAAPAHEENAPTLLARAPDPAAAAVAAPPTVATPPARTPVAPQAAPAITSGTRVAMLSLLGAAIVLAIAGQSTFEAGRPYAPDGPISPYVIDGLKWYGLAIIAFAAAAFLADRATRAQGAWPEYKYEDDAPVGVRSLLDGVQHSLHSARAQPRRLVSLLIVAGLVVVLLSLVHPDRQLPDYTLPFVIWLAAIGLYVQATVPRPYRYSAGAAPWWRSERAVVVTLVGLVLIGFALRVWHVDSLPATLGGDEGSFGLEAVKAIRGEWPNRNPFTTGWLSHPTLSFLYNSLAIRLFGQTVFGLRLAWVLVGVVTLPVVFHLVRRLSGSTLALMTAGLLATYHFHIHYSRLGVNNVADPLLVALVLLLLARAIDRRRLLDWALCGVAIGVSQFFYFGARFTAIIVAVVLLHHLICGRLRFAQAHGRGMVILLGAAVVSAAPMIQYAVVKPLDYNARFNQIGIIGPSGWLEREVVIRGQSAELILLDQLQRAGLAFNVYPDRTGWYGSPQPLFDFAAGALFLLGLGYATLRLADRRLFPMVAWWWGAMILGGMLTESPPSTQRLVTLGPPAVFFASLALFKIGQIVQHGLNAWSPRRLTPYLATAVVVLSLVSFGFYFLDFTPRRTYGTFNGAVATDLAHYLKSELGPDWRFYFFGAPRMYHDFGSIPYIVPEVEGVDITDPLTGPLDPSLVGADKDAAFIFLPERQGELAFVAQTFPGGEIEQVPSLWEGDPNPFYIVYRVQRQ